MRTSCTPPMHLLNKSSFLKLLLTALLVHAVTRLVIGKHKLTRIDLRRALLMESPTSVTVADVQDSRLNSQLQEYNAVEASETQAPKIIVIWTKFITSDESEWRKIFAGQIEGKCPDNCIVTQSKNNWQAADAIIFKQAISRHNKHYIKVKLPKTHPTHQKWILFSAEAPTHYTWKIPTKWKPIFDWTMTYHKKSDVVIPFGRVTPVKDADAKERNYWAEKSNKRFAAWMVSHCPTPSRREEYVKELQRYEDIHIYGSCGHKTCGIRRLLRYVLKEDDPDHCYNLMSTYKFYFAFENAICEDYITEKFFKALQMDAIPVVFGGGNYKDVAPPNSYINATDFPNPKDLANYLRKVANNQTLYNSFFKWKGKYEVEVGFPFDPMICDLCHQLHLQDKFNTNSTHSFKNAANKNNKGYYYNVVRWLKDVSKCRGWDQRNHSFIYDNLL